MFGITHPDGWKPNPWPVCHQGHWALDIVASGTKINIDYHLNNILDEDAQEEIYDYFLEDAESDDISSAYEEFEGDYSEEELRLMKIKFMSEMAN